MGLLNDWKRKRQQEEARAQAEEKRQQEQEIKEKDSAVRAGAEEILYGLDGIRFVSRTGRIGEEKMEEYRESAEAFRTLLRYAPTMTEDFAGIDGQILKLIALFKQALDNENEKTADRALSTIAYGVKEARTPIHASSAEQAERILGNREQKLARMIIMVEMSGEVEQLDRRIEKLDQDYEERKAEYAEAFACCQKTMKEYPELAAELDESVISKKPLSGAAICLNTQKKEVVDLYNSVNDIRRVQANMRARQEEYQANIHILELQLREASDLEAEQVTDTLRELQADFQENLRRSQREIDELSGISEQFDKLLDSVFSSPAMIDRILKTDMAYHKVVRREQQVEEGRRLAREQEQEQARMQEQETTNRLLN